MTRSPVAPGRHSAARIPLVGNVSGTALSFALLLGAVSAQTATPSTGSNTGGGAASVDAAENRSSPERVDLRFEVDTLEGVSATLEPKEAVATVEPGKISRLYFFLSNQTSRTVQLRLNYRVEPGEDSVFYNQLNGICTTGQTLDPWESALVSDSILIDPAILAEGPDDEAKVLTVHYTLRYAKEFPEFR